MRLPPECETMFARWLERVGDAWASAVPIPVKIGAESLVLVESSAFLRSLGNHVCCGRSLFAGAGRGIGGWLLPDRMADRLACAIAGLPAPPPHAVATIGGPLEDGLDRLHELFLGAWNRAAPGEWRLSEEITERAVERLGSLGQGRSEAALCHWIVSAPLEIDGRSGEIGLLVSPAMLGDAEGQGAAPTHVEPIGAAGNPPIAIVDPSGEMVRWLRSEVRAGRIECVASASRTSGDPRAATLIVGGAPGAHPVEIVTIRAAF